MNARMWILVLSFAGLLPAKGLAQEQFPYPQVPGELKTVAGRADFVVKHYWDRFDFQDTTLLHRQEMAEQGFVNFIDLLPRLGGSLAVEGIKCFSQKAFAQKGREADYFMDLSERYLFNEDSSLRNDTLYALFLEAMDGTPASDEAMKSRHRFLIENIRKNKIGTVAADFTFRDREGRQQRLHQVKSPYTLLYFYDPDCEHCNEVAAAMAKEPVITANPAVRLVEVDASRRQDLWELYFLRSFPVIYLLDAEKKVVLKDATLQQLMLHAALRPCGPPQH